MAACGARTGLESAGGGGREDLSGFLEWTLGPFEHESLHETHCLYLRLPRDVEIGAIEVKNLRQPADRVAANVYRVDEPV